MAREKLTFDLKPVSEQSMDLKPVSELAFHLKPVAESSVAKIKNNIRNLCFKNFWVLKRFNLHYKNKIFKPYSCIISYYRCICPLFVF